MKVGGPAIKRVDLKNGRLFGGDRDVREGTQCHWQNWARKERSAVEQQWAAGGRGSRAKEKGDVGLGVPGV